MRALRKQLDGDRVDVHSFSSGPTTDEPELINAESVTVEGEIIRDDFKRRCPGSRARPLGSKCSPQFHSHNLSEKTKGCPTSSEPTLRTTTRSDADWWKARKNEDEMRNSSVVFAAMPATEDVQAVMEGALQR